MMRYRILFMAFLVALVVSFMPAPESRGSTPSRRTSSPVQTPVYTYKIINTYPHDRSAFTQGLIYHDGGFYEGTGLNGRSSLRKVELETGKVLQSLPLPREYFGEGIALWGDRLVQLTWRSRVGFLYDRETFQSLGSFTYPMEIREGWGLTHDESRLIVSDGTAIIHFLDPETFERIGWIEVHEDDRAVRNLNELEFINGEIYANIWYSDRIARISPKTGQVLSWIDLAGLLSDEDRAEGADVLNGIAYDSQHERLFVTGKLWPKLFEIELVPKP